MIWFFEFVATEEKMNLRLSLLFIVMEVLTVLAYPFVFVHTKLSQLSKSMAGFVPAGK